MYKFTDEWGIHSHEITTGPYEPKLPITCVSCLHMLDSVLTEWLNTLSKRRNLPEGFWKGYKFEWSK